MPVPSPGPPEHPPEDASPQGENPERPLAGARVLVAAHTDAVRQLLLSTLTDLGATVAQAADGGKALAALSDASGAEPQLDAVLVELGMPEPGGVELVRRIRAQEALRSLPVVVLSTQSDAEAMAECLRLGVSGCMAKPFTRERVLETVTHALSGKRMAPPEGETGRGRGLTFAEVMALKQILARQAAAAARDRPAGAGQAVENPVLACFVQYLEDVVARRQQRPLSLSSRASVTVLDVSETGCGFESTFPIPEQSVLFLDMEQLAARIQVPRERLFPMRVANCARLEKRYRIGAQFIGLSDKVKRNLRRACVPAPGTAMHQPNGSWTDRSEPGHEQEGPLPGRTTVLVIDDDRAERMVLTGILEQADFDVLQASSGPAGLETLEENPHTSLVVVDWMMPGMSGIEVLAKLTAQVEPPPALVLTGGTRQENVLLGLKAGAVDCQSKPVERREFLFRVENILKHQRDGLRKRGSYRRSVVLPAAISFVIHELRDRIIGLRSFFPIPERAVLFLESRAMTERLGLSANRRFPVRVTKSERDGNQYRIGGQLVGLPAEVAERLARLHASPG